MVGVGAAFVVDLFVNIALRSVCSVCRRAVGGGNGIGGMVLHERQK